MLETCTRRGRNGKGNGNGEALCYNLWHQSPFLFLRLHCAVASETQNGRILRNTLCILRKRRRRYSSERENDWRPEEKRSALESPKKVPVAPQPSAPGPAPYTPTLRSHNADASTDGRRKQPKGHSEQGEARSTARSEAPNSRGGEASRDGEASRGTASAAGYRSRPLQR